MHINARQDYRKWWFGFPNMLNMVLHLKWLPNVFELWKLVHREAPEIHFFLTPGVGRLSVQLHQHNKLLCLILEAGKKCSSGSLVWVNLNNSNESDLQSQWGTWFCMLEMQFPQRLMLGGSRLTTGDWKLMTDDLQLEMDDWWLFGPYLTVKWMGLFLLKSPLSYNKSSENI